MQTIKVEIIICKYAIFYKIYNKPYIFECSFVALYFRWIGFCTQYLKFILNQFVFHYSNYLFVNFAKFLDNFWSFLFIYVIFLLITDNKYEFKTKIAVWS